MSRSLAKAASANSARPAVLGRTYDLKSACKQFGLCKDDRDILRLATWCPETGSPVLLGLNALPFGAVGSVAGFLRISVALWYIGTVGLGPCWTSYFDDYTVVTRSELSKSTSWAVESLFLPCSQKLQSSPVTPIAELSTEPSFSWQLRSGHEQLP